jgi:hypothetical protein
VAAERYRLCPLHTTLRHNLTFVAITSALAGKPQLHIDFSSPRSARYIKLELTQYNDGVWWRIDELSVSQ